MNPGNKAILQYSILFLLLCNVTLVSSITAQSPESFVMHQQAADEEKTLLNGMTYRAVLVAIGFSQALPYSIKQLYGFQSMLLHGGNWKASNIVTLVENQATKVKIRAAIHSLAEAADDNDVSLFYFIGHGSGNDTSHCVLCYDDTSIYDVELNQYLANVSGSLIVIVDACHSGGFIEELAHENRVVVTACAKDEAAYQVADLKSGLFGFFLNLSLSWMTKNVEPSFFWAKMFSAYYSNKLAEQYGEEYRIHPQISDGSRGMTRVILKHSYARNIYQMMQAFLHESANNRLWRL